MNYEWNGHVPLSFWGSEKLRHNILILSSLSEASVQAKMESQDPAEGWLISLLKGLCLGNCQHTVGVRNKLATKILRVICGLCISLLHPYKYPCFVIKGVIVEYLQILHVFFENLSLVHGTWSWSDLLTASREESRFLNATNFPNEREKLSLVISGWSDHIRD